MNTQVAMNTTGSMMITGNDFVMNSYDFLVEVINPIRVQNGEPEIPNYKFISKIEDELDLDMTFAKKVNVRGNDVVTYVLDMDDMTLVGMRESKGCRKQVLARLKELEQATKPATDLQVASTMNSDQLALLLRVKQEEEHAKAQLALAAPKVEFVEQYTERTTLQNATQVGSTFGMSAMKLNELLTANGVYNQKIKRKTFNTWFVEKGYGQTIQTGPGYSQAMFTPAGIFWISEHIINAETPLEKLMLN